MNEAHNHRCCGHKYCYTDKDTNELKNKLQYSKDG